MLKTIRKSVLFAAVSLVGAAAAFAQSVPTIGPPVNAGSYFQAGLPSSGIAQGSLFIIFGTGMSGSPPGNVIYATKFPLPTNLNGTSVQVTMNGTAYAAFLNYVVANQLAAILPSNVPTGDGTITVTLAGKTSNTAPIHVVGSAFGALATNASGTGPGVIFNNSQSGQPVNSLLVSAEPGQVAELWGTGLGPLPSGQSDANPPVQTPNLYPVQVFVGGVASPQVQYAGRSTFAGVDQINFVIPSGVSGCWVPVYVLIGGPASGVASNITTMAITASGGPCTDPTQISSSDLSTVQSGKNNLNVGLMTATHLTVNLNLSAVGGAISGDHDEFDAQFQQLAASTLAFNPNLISPGTPSLGYCSVAQYTYDGSILDSIGGNANYPYQFNSIGAGATLTFSGAAGSDQTAETAPGSGQYPNLPLGGISGKGGAPTPTFLNPGTFTISNVKGETIGAFSATLTLPASITWTNEPSPNATIPRSQALSVSWTGASSSEYVTVSGSSVNTTTNAGAVFTCTATGTDGKFTVPAAIVSMLPASGAAGSDKVGFLGVAKSSLRSGSSFTAPSMDLGYLTYQEAQVVNVNFQ